MLLYPAQRREIKIFVKSAKFAVLDLHRNADWDSDLSPGGRRTSDRTVLRHDTPMKILNAHLPFAAEQICHLHVDGLRVDPARHGLFCRHPDLLNSNEALACRHKGPYRVVVGKSHKAIEVVTEEAVFELFGEFHSRIH